MRKNALVIGLKELTNNSTEMNKNEVLTEIVALLNKFEGCNCDYQGLLEDVIAECEDRIAGLECDNN